MPPVIQVENLSKKYRLGVINPRDPGLQVWESSQECFGGLKPYEAQN